MVWKKLKELASKKMLGDYFLRELKYESKTVLKLSLTFVGATLVSRTVWDWIVLRYDSFTAFWAGIAILFLVAFMHNHNN